MSDILLAGDLYVGRGFSPAVEEPVRTLIGSATHALVNLEAPVTDSAERIQKTGPHLTMPTSSLDHAKRLGFTGLTLANNHILDAGLTGLADTLRLADERGLVTMGAAVDAGSAKTAATTRLPLAEGSLTILNYCEHEWSVRPDGLGASGWDVLEAFSGVREAHENGDRVLVVVHGGNEYYPLPRPRLRRELRFLADNGADAIVMHHSHVPGAYEVWNGVPIFYGLGNFQFTLPSPNAGWYEGLMVGLRFAAREPVAFDLYPIRQNRDFSVLLAPEDERLATLRELEGYRIQVASDGAVLARWTEFTRAAAGTFAQQVAPTSRLRPRRLRRLAEMAVSREFSRDREARMAALNYMRCESHHEAIMSSLGTQLP
jgi:poly-gamma-glutamate capsule biosynthesis protein CapA/YwtB (metallophosphatase superfamily)